MLSPDYQTSASLKEKATRLGSQNREASIFIGQVTGKTLQGDLFTALQDGTLIGQLAETLTKVSIKMTASF